MKKSFAKGVKGWLEAAPFILPSLILMSGFVLFPMVKNIRISMFQYNIMKNECGEFIGLANYAKILGSSEFHLALKNTLIYTSVTVVGQMFLGFILAYLIDNTRTGQTFFKVLTYLPVVTSWVVVSLLFKYIFASGKGGLVNYWLRRMGLIASSVSWLQSPGTANTVLCFFGIWKGVGWTMLVYFAALQGVSRTIYDAAKIDGANNVQTMLYITFPMVKNTSLYLLTVLTIGGFGAYIHVMMITEGGPLGQTKELMNLIYDTAFVFWDFSYAAAMSVIMGIMIFSLSFIQRRISKERVE